MEAVWDYLTHEAESLESPDWHKQALQETEHRLATGENRTPKTIRMKNQATRNCKLDWGPGYRVYIGRDGDKLILLLCGGTKKRQSKDIEQALELWQEYKN
jgi:putative addiction module killer protein